MTFRETKEQFFNELLEQYDCLTKEELITRLGKTTIRCAWVDYTDMLCRDKVITEKQKYSWGQVI